MSIKRKVSIHGAVVRAMDQMAIDDITDNALFKSWAVEADRKIGSYYAYRKNIHVLDVVNCRAKLPCEAVGVLGLLFGDCGCDCGLTFENIYRGYSPSVIAPLDGRSGFIVIDASSGAYTLGGYSWNIQNNCIVFNGNYDGQKITVQTLDYEIDSDGFPFVNENHEEAIAQFIELKNARRQRWKKDGIRLYPTEIKEIEREWHRLCANARAEDAEPSPSERAALAAMINDPLSGIGMALWNYNDVYYGYH